MTDVVDRLQERFPQHTRAAVTEAVHDSHREFERSRIRDFVPILVERKARDRLSTQAPVAPAAPTPTIPAQNHEVAAETLVAPAAPAAPVAPS